VSRLSLEDFYQLADALTRPQRQVTTGHICLRNGTGDAFITVVHGRAIALDTPRRMARVRGPERIAEDLLHYLERGVPTHRFAPADDPPTTPSDAEPLCLELIVHTLLRTLAPERLASAAEHQRSWRARLVTPVEEIALRLELPLRGMAEWLAPALTETGTVGALLGTPSPVEQTPAQLLVLLHATGHLAIANAEAPRSPIRSAVRPRASMPPKASAATSAPPPRRHSGSRQRAVGERVDPPDDRALGVREVRQKVQNPKRFRPEVSTKRRKIAPKQRRASVPRKNATPLPFNSVRDVADASEEPLSPTAGLPIDDGPAAVPSGDVETHLQRCLADLNLNNFSGAHEAAQDAVALTDDYVAKLHLLWTKGMKETQASSRTVGKIGPQLAELCRLTLLTEPGRAFAHYVRGEVARHQGRRDEAERCLKQALKCDSGFIVPKRVLSAMKSGEVA